MGMRKTLLLVAIALTMLGSLAVHADPPAPLCPPVGCDKNGNPVDGNS
jgi:hypothetical protein